MALPEDPADRHAAVAGDFGRLVARTPDWSAPSPVDGWTARDVVRHLLEWLPGLLESGAGIRLAPVDVDAGPAAA